MIIIKFFILCTLLIGFGFLFFTKDIAISLMYGLLISPWVCLLTLPLILRLVPENDNKDNGKSAVEEIDEGSVDFIQLEIVYNGKDKLNTNDPFMCSNQVSPDPTLDNK